jgi:hypothetical protein
MKLKTVLHVLFLLSAAMPAFADSKSATVQVSCTVPAMIELAAPIAQAVSARSNLSNQYQMTEGIGLRDGQSIKLYSLTAL